MASAKENEALSRVFYPEPVVVAAGSSAVIDVRGCAGLVAYSAGGTATAQPCDETGTALPGAAAAALTLGERLDALAPFYKVAATTQAVTVVVV